MARMAPELAKDAASGIMPERDRSIYTFDIESAGGNAHRSRRLMILPDGRVIVVTVDVLPDVLADGRRGV